MKRLKTGSCAIILGLSLSMFTHSTEAAGSYPCSVDHKNLLEVNELLTEKAKKYDIPPEVVKAIALRENKDWDQSYTHDDNNDGKPDGLGLMQVTDNTVNGRTLDRNLLQTNVCYNVDAGLQILESKWLQSSLPQINTMDRDIIENWYFAVMAYNGVVSKNSPIDKSGAINKAAYQYIVFDYIKEFSYNREKSLSELSFKPEYFDYGAHTGEIIKFKKLQYTDYSKPFTHSGLNLTQDSLAVLLKEANFYSGAAGEFSTKIAANTLVEITDGTHYVNEKDFGPKRHWVRFKVKVLDGPLKGKTGFIGSPYLKPITDKLAGETRSLTAVAISQDGWREGADTVILARGDQFPDALAGVPLSGKYDAPILLTSATKTELNPDTKAEIKRLGAKKVIILGSNSAVPAQAEDELKDLGLKTTRIEGKDRYQTAANIADYLASDKKTAILTTGKEFADALAAAPYASKQGIPIYLTNPTEISALTLSHLNKMEKVIILGSDDAVADKIESSIKADTVRIKGETRYETAEQFIKTFNMGHHDVFVATGKDFPDALAGAALAGKRDSVILFTKKDEIPVATERLIRNRGFSHFTFLGDEGVLNTAEEVAGIAK
ncbi:cell wall-binding repeat-containing protein [Metabacillus indicus]|uniref:cell wall-binding repeat-containing protein n=1 Tax=Metabacillus indicus TaxID=246786 RepID=UPI00068F3880|nr:cell wall-binding repeat-containing protein [Metabacillus indicus]